MSLVPILIPIAVFTTVVTLSYLINALRSAPVPPSQFSWAAHIPVQYVEVEGLRLRYLTVGTGTPLILLHTFRTQLDIFQKVIPTLSRHFQVFALDYPGHGFSDIPKAEYTPKFLLKFVRGFMEVLDINGAIVVGESIGGTLALLLAAERNPRVSQVMAINPFDYEARRGIMRATWVARVVFTLTQVPLLGSTIWRFRPLPPFRKIMLSGLYRPEAMPPTLLQEMYEAGHRPHHYKAFISFILHFPEWDRLRTDYEKIETPVNLIYGDHDWSMPEDRADNLRRIPNARMMTIKNAGHFLSLDRPDQVIRVILDLNKKPGQEILPTAAPQIVTLYS